MYVVMLAMTYNMTYEHVKHKQKYGHVKMFIVNELASNIFWGSNKYFKQPAALKHTYVHVLYVRYKLKTGVSIHY